jgi:hypothetical protein
LLLLLLLLLIATNVTKQFGQNTHVSSPELN